LGLKSNDVSCNDLGGRATVVVRTHQPQIGDPSLAFDLESAALMRTTVTNPDGTWSATTYEEWSEKDESGVRWPVKSTTRSAIEDSTHPRVLDAKPGADCGAEPPEGCYGPPEMKLLFHWPKNGRASMKFDGALSEVMVRAKVGGREVYALLDSGAGMT